LYVGGEFESGLPVRARNLARWDGTSWHAVGSGLNGPVLALACASGNRLVVGGSFTTLGNNASPTSHFAVLDPAACQPPAHRPPARGRRRAARPTGSTRKEDRFLVVAQLSRLQGTDYLSGRCCLF
jgi:hypothetical protein